VGARAGERAHDGRAPNGRATVLRRRCDDHMSYMRRKKWRLATLGKMRGANGGFIPCERGRDVWLGRHIYGHAQGCMDSSLGVGWSATAHHKTVLKHI